MFKPGGDQIRVIWSMHGENGFVGKAFSLFMDMDKMLGWDFEKDLATPKSGVPGASTTGALNLPARN